MNFQYVRRCEVRQSGEVESEPQDFDPTCVQYCIPGAFRAPNGSEGDPCRIISHCTVLQVKCLNSKYSKIILECQISMETNWLLRSITAECCGSHTQQYSIRKELYELTQDDGPRIKEGHHSKITLGLRKSFQFNTVNLAVHVVEVFLAGIEIHSDQQALIVRHRKLHGNSAKWSLDR